MENKAAQQRIVQISQQIVQDADDKDSMNEYKQLWAGFYKKTLQQRLDQLKKIQNVNIEQFKDGGLTLQNANLMVENCIGKLSLPMGLGLNFLINGQYYVIPMVIEEPSVIAAASAAAKTIAECGYGFNTYSTRPVMMGQIQLLNVENFPKLDCLIDSNKVAIINRGNQVCQSMVKRGGGVEDVKCRFLGEEQASIDIFINVCDSMGANIVNTVMEHLAPLIEEISGCKTGIKILTNLCLNRKVTSLFKLKISKMNYKDFNGQEVAEMLINTYKFAELDIYRAVTHNKGIINGIEAVCNATGQDTRAVSASLHGYASMNGKYKPLSKFYIENGYFYGELTVPISVGSQGGVIPQNPVYSSVFQILDYPDSQKLAEIIVSVGLAQNFAAMRALSAEGIQRGHMTLHAKNIAIAVGVPEHQVEEAVLFMKNRGSYKKETALEFLNAYKIYQEIGKVRGKKNQTLCTFSASFQLEGSQEIVELHVVFDCHSNERIDLNFLSQSPISLKLFGQKSHQWFQNLFKVINLVRFVQQPDLLTNKNLAVKLKVISILINLLSYNLLIMNFEKTKNYLAYILQQQQVEFPDGDIEFKYGIALLTELLHIFEYNIDQFIGNQLLRNELLTEQKLIVNSNINCFELWYKAKQEKVFHIDKFWEYRKKRLSCTMMLLCDCINFQVIDEKLMNQMKQLGDIYEIEITLARDTEKWKEATIKDPNIYMYWLLQHDQLLQGDRFCVSEQFKNESSAMLEMKRQKTQPLLPSSMTHLSNQATSAVRLLYKSNL